MRQKIENEIKIYQGIDEFVDKYEVTTLKEIVDFIYQKYGVMTTKRTISLRLRDKHGYELKWRQDTSPDTKKK